MNKHLTTNLERMWKIVAHKRKVRGIALGMPSKAMVGKNGDKVILFYGHKQSKYAQESFKDLCLAFHRFSTENLKDSSKNALT